MRWNALDPARRRRAAAAFWLSAALAAGLGSGGLWLWWAMHPPLPPLADDAPGYAACAADPQADGCAAWSHFGRGR